MQTFRVAAYGSIIMVCASLATGLSQNGLEQEKMIARLKSIVLPELKVEDATFNQVLAILGRLTANASTNSSVIKFTIQFDTNYPSILIPAKSLATPKDLAEIRKIEERLRRSYQLRIESWHSRTTNLSLHQVPVYDAVQYISVLQGLDFRIVETGVEFGIYPPQLCARFYSPIRSGLSDSTNDVEVIGTDYRFSKIFVGTKYTQPPLIILLRSENRLIRIAGVETEAEFEPAWKEMWMQELIDPK
jgi:hypothetical protein